MLKKGQTPEIERPNHLSALVFTYWFLWCVQGPLAELLFQNVPRGKIILTLCIGPTFLILASFNRGTKPENRGFHARSIWILVYLGWAGLSLLWTYADNRLFATAVFISWAAEVAAVVLLCGKTNGFRSALSGLIAGACSVAVILGVALWMNPDVVTLEHLSAQPDNVVNPNLFGYKIAIGDLACCFLYLKGKRRVLAVCLFLTVALIATASKTSIISFAALILVYVLLARASRIARLSITTVLFLGISFGVPFAIHYFQIYEKREMLTTLTGRVPLWQSILDRIAERPICGYGFLSVKDIADSSWGAMHAHNDFLQQWASLGLIGLTLALLLHAIVWRRLRSSSSPMATLGLLWLIFAIGHGVLDSDMIAFGFPLQLMVLFLSPLPTSVQVLTHGRRAKADRFSVTREHACLREDLGRS